MPKEIRFTKLVQKAGRPETMMLWTKPKDNPAFLKALRENRIVTVFQNPAGTKQDLGAIGFHQEKFATYLVFPKPLPKLGDDIHVIGIKYEWLQEQPEKRLVKEKVASPKTNHKEGADAGSNRGRKGIRKTKLDGESVKKFQVKLVRTGTLQTVITVSAKTIAEAEAKALKTVKANGFQPDEVYDEVKSIAQI